MVERSKTLGEKGIELRWWGRVRAGDHQVAEMVDAVAAYVPGYRLRVPPQFADDRVSVFLEVEEDNTPARRLYQRSGFREVGRRPGYYRQDRDKAATALVLRRDLV